MYRYKLLRSKIFTWRKEIIAALILGLCTIFPCIYEHNRATTEHNNAVVERNKAKYYVSGGQAVGYFYNFIYQLFEKDSITVDMLLPLSKDKDSVIGRKTFSRKNIKIKVLLPYKLTSDYIKLINKKTTEHRKGTIIYNGKRDKAIRFEEENGNIIIYDAANPLNAVRKYLENIPEFKSGFDSTGKIFDAAITESFGQRAKEEIDNFQNTIMYFINKEETKPIIGEDIIEFSTPPQ